jgi:hypothetical protein
MSHVDLTKLQELADYFADSKQHDHEQTILDAIDKIRTFEKGLDIYERERQRFRHAKPEYTGVFFLAGGHGNTDDNLLPEFVEICPAYGAGWVQVYQKTDKTISHEGG